MTHTMSVIPHDEPWLRQESVMRQRREHVQGAGGRLLALNCVPGSPWSGAETAVPEALRRAASGALPLHAACATLALYQEEQARTAVDLLDRETWAVTVLLAASGPIWDRMRRPTLRFPLQQVAGSAPCHLEVGTFPHLSALIAPSAGERTLAAATTPCWARVSPHPERQGAGQIGAAACAYVPIPTAEAVSTLGLGRILAEIDAATREAGQAILAQAQEHAARHEFLLCVEQMLGWEQAPIETAPSCQLLPRTGRMFVLLARGGRHLATDVAVLGVIMAVLCLVIGIPGALLPLALVVPALFIWLRGAIG